MKNNKKFEIVLNEKIQGVSLLERIKDLLKKKATKTYSTKVDDLLNGSKTEIIWWHKGTKGRFSLQHAMLLIKALDDLGLTPFIEREVRGKQEYWNFTSEFLEFLKSN